MAFKTDEEVKEYLDNLGIEYKFTCFKEKNAEACHLLADYLEALKKDFEGAAKIFKSNCDERKYPKSCLKYGNFCYLGKGIDVDLHSALQYYKTTCDLGSAEGCLHVGAMLTSKDEYRESTIKLDKVTGLKYLEKACEIGNTPACFLASGLYLKGTEGIPQDKAKASRFSQTACDGGNIYACMNLSQMYRTGDGIEKSEEKAKLFKEKAKKIRDDHKKKPNIELQQFI